MLRTVTQRLLVLCVVLVSARCAPEREDHEGLLGGLKGIEVVVEPGDVQDLYAKLKSPATAGRTLVLSGTYMLTPAGEGADTKGYVELGDRHLRGTTVLVDDDGDGVPDRVDPTGETRIDGSSLDVDLALEPIVGPDGFTGAQHRPLIRAAQGNSIAGIVVRWKHLFRPGTDPPQFISSAGAIGILAGTGARVTGCVVEGADLGIWITNNGAASVGAEVSAVVSGSIVSGGSRPGLLICNLGTADAGIQVSLRGNRVQGGAGGTPLVFVGNFFCDESTVSVLSHGNLYRGRTAGTALAVLGGTHFGLPKSGTLANRTDFVSISDAIQDNRFGVDLVGGANAGPEPYTCDDNQATMDLIGVRFSGNQTTINAAGARAANLVAGQPPPIQGSRNQARLRGRLLNFEGGGPFVANHAVGTDGGVDNRLIVAGTESAWMAANPGMPLPSSLDVFSGVP